MSELRFATDTSRVLDDKAGGRLDRAFSGLARVDAALSDAEAVPCERPVTDIRARVMARLETPEATGGRGALWWLAAAACLTLGVGTTWLVLRSMHAIPGAPTARLADSGPSAPASPLGFEALLRPFDTSGPALRASVEAPFLREAALIREDTQQGLEMVLSRLPLGSANPVR